jgi:hypothetical protein
VPGALPLLWENGEVVAEGGGDGGREHSRVDVVAFASSAAQVGGGGWCGPRVTRDVDRGRH